MGPCTDKTDILGIAWHWMRIGSERRGGRPLRWLSPPTRRRVAIRKRENSGVLVMQSAWGGEVRLRICNGNFKGSIANAQRLHVDEHEQFRRLAKIGIAFVKRHRRDGGKLLCSTVQIIIHRIAAQLVNAPPAHGVNSPLGGTKINRDALQVSRECGFLDICERLWRDKAWGGSMDGALDPVQSGSRCWVSAHVRRQAAIEVILVHGPGQRQLFVIAQALSPQRLAFGFRQSRQEQGCQDSDDRDHDQQLNQRKAATVVWVHSIFKAGCFVAISPADQPTNSHHKKYAIPV